MAAYREHLTTSCILGIGVCSAAISLGFTPVQGVLAGTITGVGGILPDLDSESGRPVREVFGVTAAFAPLMMTRRLMEWGGNTDGTMLLAVLTYITVRYGGATLLAILAVHRGMFHSIPAMIIAGELAFLGYKSDQLSMKVLMGVGIMIGFLSHLILDEIYSVQWDGGKLRLNKFSGSAVKWVGKSFPGNVFSYGLLFMLTYGVWIEGKLDERLNARLAEQIKKQSVTDDTEEIPAPVSPTRPKTTKPRTPQSSPIPTPPAPIERRGTAPTSRPTGRLAEQDELGRDPFQ